MSVAMERAEFEALLARADAQPTEVVEAVRALALRNHEVAERLDRGEDAMAWEEAASDLRRAAESLRIAEMES